MIIVRRGYSEHIYTQTGDHNLVSVKCETLHCTPVTTLRSISTNQKQNCNKLKYRFLTDIYVFGGEHKDSHLRIWFCRNDFVQLAHQLNDYNVCMGEFVMFVKNYALCFAYDLPSCCVNCHGLASQHTKCKRLLAMLCIHGEFENKNDKSYAKQEKRIKIKNGKETGESSGWRWLCHEIPNACRRI